MITLTFIWIMLNTQRFSLLDEVFFQYITQVTKGKTSFSYILMKVERIKQKKKNHEVVEKLRDRSLSVFKLSIYYHINYVLRNG